MKHKKLFTGILILIILLSLAGGWITLSTNRDHPVNFFSASWNSCLSIVKLLLILLLIWCIFYMPVIWIIRKWWAKRKSRIDLKNSQGAKALSRFIVNSPALFGVVTIFYALLLFIFGHGIAPDKTPFANDQVNELSYRPPGFTIQLLNVPLKREPVKTGFFRWLIYGKPLNYQLIPLNNYHFSGDSIYVEKYIGEHIAGQSIGFKMQDITHQYISVAENQKLIQDNFINTRKYLFGTDDLGRDYLSRTILGVRVSLSVGFVAVLIALLIGIPIGAFAGFYKKDPPKIRIRKRYLRFPLDDFIMWFINVIWAIPTLLLVFPIVFAFGQNFYTIFIAVGLTMWVDIARLVRGQVMSVRELEFVQATRTFGFSDFRTIFRHILPNISGPVIVITAANFAYAILTEAGLSFLGIGVQPPAPSWGLMISKYKDNLITDPYLPLIPGVAITLLVLAFFMVGNGLRDALDVKTKVGS